MCVRVIVCACACVCMCACACSCVRACECIHISLYKPVFTVLYAPPLKRQAKPPECMNPC